MKLPKQAIPVQRTTSAKISNQKGVEASQAFDIILRSPTFPEEETEEELRRGEVSASGFGSYPQILSPNS